MQECVEVTFLQIGSSSESEYQEVVSDIILKQKFKNLRQELILRNSDIEKLLSRDFLNDSLIDFYLQQLIIRHLFDGESSLYVFSSLFYPTLSAHGAEYQIQSYKRYNLAEKDYWLIPVATNQHWILFVVRLFSQDRYIAILDSLNFEWNDELVEIMTFYQKLMISCQLKDRLNIKVFSPICPIQENFYDCGCFILQFAENFRDDKAYFEDLLMESQEENPDLSGWFTAHQVSMKRFVFAYIILEKAGIILSTLSDFRIRIPVPKSLVPPIRRSKRQRKHQKVS